MPSGAGAVLPPAEPGHGGILGRTDGPRPDPRDREEGIGGSPGGSSVPCGRAVPSTGAPGPALTTKWPPAPARAVRATGAAAGSRGSPRRSPGPSDGRRRLVR
ncbi:hypothetical protein HMPREF0682_1132 [Propionibacterium acidifaciens F0233]|uniref:Uncharacterized protein n=1 Tax=Propionibacterium acidifaciens F0233 TaxID=553198 RepID=U2QLL6_9ACTN|nr:hypothetical protein HMPREF0682_1132 [Propionibacterium acidifaciens F0233]